MNNDYILKVINLKKIFTDELATPLEVLKNINLNIKNGEYVSLMGESGSGKSTLLYQIGCLDTPSEGNILIDGIDIMNLNDTEKSKLRCEKIGFVFQFYNLIPNLSVEENILLPVIMSGRKISDYKEKLDEILTIVGLKNRRTYLPKQLSGGQQQRVSIERAVIMEPKLLLADEPTGNLDSVSSEEILRLFKKLNKEKNITIVQVTHSMEVANYSDRIVYLKDGMIVSRGSDDVES